MQQRRERILRAAREIVAERGYEALTLRDLARSAGVTVPTIYNLIGSKDRVLLAAVEEQLEHFISGIAARDSARPGARVLSVVESCVSELLRLPRYYRSLLRLLFASDAAAEARNRVGATLVSELAQALDEVDAAGDLCEWVDSRLLVSRLSAQLGQVSLEWAAGSLTNDGLRATSEWEACIMLAGATRGKTRRELERTAKAAQARASGRPSRRRAAPARRASGVRA